MADLRAAFSLVPEYLRTLDRSAAVRDVYEYTPQLGRRFRALKLWLMLRWFGLEGIRRRLRHHIEQAAAFAGWIDDDPDWERLASVLFSTVCFRYRPRSLAERAADPEVVARLDALNSAILDAVHTRLRDRFTIRVALGQLRTEDRHVARAWALLRREAARLDA
jgi:aromatic-L-amino-acid decarboxylase